MHVKPIATACRAAVIAATTAYFVAIGIFDTTRRTRHEYIVMCYFVQKKD